jgi:hypothetical protein
MQPNEYSPKPENNIPPAETPLQPQERISSTQRIIQPLSSEADILAASTPPVNPTQASTEARTPVDATHQPVEEYYGISTLPNEPLPHSALQPQSVLRPQPVDQPKKKRHILPIVALIFVAGIGAAAYLVLGYGRVATSDLVQTDTQNTTYLRPQQWKMLGLATTSSYGNKQAKDNKSTALVAVNVSPSANSTLATASEDTFQFLRTSLLNAITEQTIAPAFKNSGAACTSDVDLQKEADTSTTPTTTGLYRLTATCKHSTNANAYVMKMRGVAGRDGHMRTIALIAVQSSWDKNKDAYEKIIDSLHQTDPQT